MEETNIRGDPNIASDAWVDDNFGRVGGCSKAALHTKCGSIIGRDIEAGTGSTVEDGIVFLVRGNHCSAWEGGHGRESSLIAGDLHPIGASSP